MIKKLLAVFALTFSAGASAQTYFYSGNELLAFINSASAHDNNKAALYVAGALDVGMMENTICIPSEARLSQSVAIVKRHLESSPEYRHLSASRFVQISVKKAWPCPKQ